MSGRKYCSYPSVAAAAYGDEGKNNGVSVGVGNLAAGDAGQTTPTFTSDSNNPFGVSVQVTIDNKTSGADLTMAVAYEGRHVADAQAFVAAASADLAHMGFAGIAGALNRTKYDREFRAYTVTSLIAQGLGQEGLAFGGHEIWYKGWREADRSRLRSEGIRSFLPGPQYHLSPQSPGPRFIPFEWRGLRLH